MTTQIANLDSALKQDIQPAVVTWLNNDPSVGAWVTYVNLDDHSEYFTREQLDAMEAAGELFPSPERVFNEQQCDRLKFKIRILEAHCACGILWKNA